jgi:hypothetical protein
LIESLGAQYHEGDFKPKLKAISGAQPDEIASKAAAIEGLYRDAITYLRTGADRNRGVQGARQNLGPEENRDEGSERDTAPRGTHLPEIEGSTRTLHGEDSEGKTIYWIRIKMDAEALDDALTLLQALHQKLINSPKKAGKPGSGKAGPKVIEDPSDLA